MNEAIHHIPDKEEVSGFMHKFRNQFIEENKSLLTACRPLKFKFMADGEDISGDQTPDDLDLEHGCQIEVCITDCRSCGEISCTCDDPEAGKAQEQVPLAPNPQPNGAFVFIDDTYATVAAAIANSASIVRQAAGAAAAFMHGSHRDHE